MNRNEQCPYCKEDIKAEHLDAQFSDSDYNKQFDVGCPSCYRVIRVHVISIPYYESNKKERDSEGE